MVVYRINWDEVIRWLWAIVSVFLITLGVVWLLSLVSCRALDMTIPL